MGQVLLCTEHGVFTYDGSRFIDLGPEHGLPQGGIVSAIERTESGRLAIQYSNEIYVSDHATDSSHPATSLSFTAFDHPGISFYDEYDHRLVAWHDGFVLLVGDSTIGIEAPLGRRAVARSMGYEIGERALLHGATAIFSVRGRLWETMGDRRICSAEPGAVHCYDAAAGLTGGPWRDIVAGVDGHILARSASSVATLDPGSNHWSVVALPDQGGAYQGYEGSLGLYKTPNGRVITQSAQGLDILEAQGWRELTVANGAPDGIVADAMADAAGQLWFHVLGRGLVRWIGYGHWDTVERSDGLSAGFPWQTARSDDGHLWVSTDGGLDELVRQGSSRHVSRAYPFRSYALASTSEGEVWAGYGGQGVRIVDVHTGSVSTATTPSIDTIVAGRDHMVWLGTDKGLYRVNDRSRPPFRPVLLKEWATPVEAVVLDDGSGVYYLTGGRLHHWHPDGSDVTVSGPGWPDDAEPMVLATARDGSLWIGGPRGLAHLVLSGDHISSYDAIPVEDTGTTTIYAVMIDHRGWVWVGTSLGISVYDGTRWVSVDADQGLLSNDVNEDGIREDPDGSVWIGDRRRRLAPPRSGLALRRASPERDRDRRPPRGAAGRCGDAALYPGPTLDRARHAETTASNARCCSATGCRASMRARPPPPRARSAIRSSRRDATSSPSSATTGLNHEVSKPTTLVVDVGYPWWRRWWSESLWAALAAACAYAGVRIRYRAMYARQAELQRHVARATAQLRHEAAHDRLTGLLTRSEIETRLAARLARGRRGEELVVALLDVDHFKRINDRHGHLGGDEVLRSLGRLISRAMRPGEYAGRYGGEEMLLVLADTDGCAAERVLKLHLAIRHDTFRVADGPISVTCSIGVAWVGDGDGWESLIGRADAALYEAKGNGRDRVIESRSEEARVRG